MRFLRCPVAISVLQTEKLQSADRPQSACEHPSQGIAWTEMHEMSMGVAGLSHMTFSKLGQEASQKLVIPSGPFEFSLHRAPGTFQFR